MTTRIEHSLLFSKPPEAPVPKQAPAPKNPGLSPTRDIPLRLRSLPRDNALVDMQEAGLLNAEFEFLEKTYQNVHHSDVPEHLKPALRALVKDSIPFPISVEMHNLKISYEIRRSYVDLIRSIYEFAKTNHIRIDRLGIKGSECYRIAGVPFCLSELIPLHPALEKTASFLNPDKFKSAADIDIHIYYTPLNGFQSGLENALVMDLVRQHYRLPHFLLGSLRFEGLEPLIAHVAKLDSPPSETLSVANQTIPWLSQLKLQKHRLSVFWNAAKTVKDGDLDSIDEIAAKYIFEMPLEQLKGYICAKGSALGDYHPEMVPNKKDWVRMTCKAEREYDFVFIKMNRMPALKMHEFCIEMKPSKTTLLFSKQALLDKLFDLIRWDYFDKDTEQQWGFHWYLITQGRTCPQMHADRILTDRLTEFSKKQKHIAGILLNAFQSRLQKKVFHSPTFIACYFLNACCQLPSTPFTDEEIETLWDILPLFFVLQIPEFKKEHKLIKAFINQDMSSYHIHLEDLIRQTSSSYAPFFYACKSLKKNRLFLWELVQLLMVVSPQTRNLLAPLMQKEVSCRAWQAHLWEMFHSQLWIPETVRTRAPFKADLTSHNGQLSIRVKIEDGCLLFPFDPQQSLKKLRECFPTFPASLLPLLETWRLPACFLLQVDKGISDNLHLYREKMASWTAEAVSCLETSHPYLVKIGYSHLMAIHQLQPSAGSRKFLKLYLLSILKSEQNNKAKLNVLKFVRPLFISVNEALEKIQSDLGAPEADFDWIEALASSGEADQASIAVELWKSLCPHLPQETQIQRSLNLIARLACKRPQLSIELARFMEPILQQTESLWKECLQNLLKATSHYSLLESYGHTYSVLGLIQRTGAENLAWEHLDKLLKSSPQDAFEFLKLAIQLFMPISGIVLKAVQTHSKMLLKKPEAAQEAAQLLLDLHASEIPYAPLLFSCIAQQFDDQQQVIAVFKKILDQTSDDEKAVQTLCHWQEQGLLSLSTTASGLWIQRCEESLQTSNILNTVQKWQAAEEKGVFTQIDFLSYEPFFLQFLQALRNDPEKRFTSVIKKVADRIEMETQTDHLFFRQKVLIEQTLALTDLSAIPKLFEYAQSDEAGPREGVAQTLQSLLVDACPRNLDTVLNYLQQDKVKGALGSRYSVVCHACFMKTCEMKPSPSTNALAALALSVAQKIPIGLALACAKHASKIKPEEPFQSEFKKRLPEIYQTLAESQEDLIVLQLFQAFGLPKQEEASPFFKRLLQMLLSSLKNKSLGIPYAEIVKKLSAHLKPLEAAESCLLLDVAVELLSKRLYDSAEILCTKELQPNLEKAESGVLISLARGFVRSPLHAQKALGLAQAAAKKSLDADMRKELLACLHEMPEELYQKAPAACAEIALKAIEQQTIAMDKSFIARLRKLCAASPRDALPLLETMNCLHEGLWADLFDHIKKDDPQEFLRLALNIGKKRIPSLEYLRDFDRFKEWIRFEGNLAKLGFWLQDTVYLACHLRSICEFQSPLNQLHPKQKIPLLRTQQILPFLLMQPQPPEMLKEFLPFQKAFDEYSQQAVQQSAKNKIDLLFSTLFCKAKDPLLFREGCALFEKFYAREGASSEFLQSIGTVLGAYQVERTLCVPLVSLLEKIDKTSQNLDDLEDLVAPLCHVNVPESIELAYQWALYTLEKNAKNPKKHLVLLKLLADQRTPQSVGQLKGLLKFPKMKSVASDIKELSDLSVETPPKLLHFFQDPSTEALAKEICAFFEKLSDKHFTPPYPTEQASDSNEILSKWLNQRQLSMNFSTISKSSILFFCMIPHMRTLLTSKACINSIVAVVITDTFERFYQSLLAKIQDSDLPLVPLPKHSFENERTIVLQFLNIQGLKPEVNGLMMGYLCYRLLYICKAYPENKKEIAGLLEAYALQKEAQDVYYDNVHQFCCKSLLVAATTHGIYQGFSEEQYKLCLYVKMTKALTFTFSAQARIDLAKQMMQKLADQGSPNALANACFLIDDSFEASGKLDMINFLIAKAEQAPRSIDFAAVNHALLRILLSSGISEDIQWTIIQRLFSVSLDILKKLPSAQLKPFTFLLEHLYLLINKPGIENHADLYLDFRSRLDPFFFTWNQALTEGFSLESSAFSKIEQLKDNLQLLWRVYTILKQCKDAKLLPIAKESWKQALRKTTAMAFEEQPQDSRQMEMLELILTTQCDGALLGCYEEDYTSYLELLQQLTAKTFAVLHLTERPEINLGLLVYLYANETETLQPKDSAERRLRAQAALAFLNKLQELNTPAADICACLIWALKARLFKEFDPPLETVCRAPHLAFSPLVWVKFYKKIWSTENPRTRFFFSELAELLKH